MYEVPFFGIHRRFFSEGVTCKLLANKESEMFLRVKKK